MLNMAMRNNVKPRRSSLTGRRRYAVIIKIDFNRLFHDKLTGYAKGVACQLFISNILNLFRRSDFNAVFLFVEGEL